MRNTSLGIALSTTLVFTPVAMAHDAHHSADHTAAWAAAEPSTTIEVTECWIRNIPQPAPSAGYFIVKNNGKEDVHLLAAVSSQYGSLMLHQTVDEEGMSKMKMADQILIKAADTLDFKPGGYHAMLEQPTSTLSVGDQVKIEFLFDNHTKLVAQCEVKAPAARSY